MEIWKKYSSNNLFFNFSSLSQVYFYFLHKNLNIFYLIIYKINITYKYVNCCKTLRHLTVRCLEKFMRIKYVANIRTSRRRLYLHKYHEESQVYSHFGCMFVRNKIY